MPNESEINQNNLTLNRIEVRGLFSKFDYDIPISDSGRVTIIYGLNGSGKTTILQLLEALPKFDWGYLQKTPFGRVSLQFNEGNLEIVKNESEESPKGDQEQSELVIKWTDETSRNSVEVRVPPIEELMHLPPRYPVVTGLRKKKSQIYHELHRFRDLRNYITQREEMIKYPHRYGPITEDFEEPVIPIEELWKEIRSLALKISNFSERKEGGYNEASQLIHVLERIPFALLPAARLFEKEKKKSKVQIYAQELRKDLMKARDKHSEESQRLDRSFPKMAVEWTREKETKTGVKDTTTVEDASIALEEKYQELVQVGLLEGEEEESYFLTEDEKEIVKAHETLGYVFAAHYSNLSKKLGGFDKLFNKVDLLRRAVEGFYHKKTIRASSEKGLIALVDKDEPLPLTLLSSGEQHILILAYYLIFKTRENQLVMIDEPELSLHSGWQERYVENLEEIGKEKNLSFILATHSFWIYKSAKQSAVELPSPD